MTKTKILQALNIIVIPLTFDDFCLLQRGIYKSEIQNSWDVLISTGYVGSIESQQCDLKQLTSLGHQAIALNTDIDKLQEIPNCISKHIDKVLFILATSNTPLSAKDTYRGADVAKQAIHVHLDVLIMKGLVKKQGKIKKIRYSCTRHGIDKNNKKCQQTHPNRCTKAMLMALIEKNGTMTLNKLNNAIYSENRRTRSRRSRIAAICRVLATEQKINITYDREIARYAFIKVKMRVAKKKIEKSSVIVVKKAERIADGTRDRTLMQILSGITQNRETCCDSSTMTAR